MSRWCKAVDVVYIFGIFLPYPFESVNWDHVEVSAVVFKYVGNFLSYLNGGVGGDDIYFRVTFKSGNMCKWDIGRWWNKSSDSWLATGKVFVKMCIMLLLM